MGGTFCENSDIGYEDAIAIRKNGSAQIYNTVVEGFNRYGLFLEGSNIIAKTKSGTDQLIFSNNSLHDLGSPEYSQQFTSPHASWAAADGCRLNPSGTMQNWIEGTALSSCNQTGNQFSLLATGYYKNSLCGDKCSTFPNLFINESTTDLEAPDYGMLSGFFDQPAFRGALQTSANTWLKSTWVDFCMLTRNYCE